MNTNNKKVHMPLTLRAKKSFLGRIICRVAGEETGAVMMEYVIVATLIAAACAVGAYFFGGTILNMFSADAQATAGKTTDASKTVTDSQSQQTTLKSAAQAHAKKFNSSDETDKPFATSK